MHAHQHQMQYRQLIVQIDVLKPVLSVFHQQCAVYYLKNMSNTGSGVAAPGPAFFSKLANSIEKHSLGNSPSVSSLCIS